MGVTFSPPFIRSNFHRVPAAIFGNEPESGSYFEAILSSWAKNSNDTYAIVRNLTGAAKIKKEAVIGVWEG